MKKAKEYATELEQNPSDQKLAEIARAFILEIREVAELRKCQQDSAFVAVLNGQREKWRAFYRLVSKTVPELRVRADGFERMIQHELPEIYGAWTVHNPAVRVQD